MKKAWAWEGVRDFDALLPNESVREGGALVPNRSFGLGGPQTEHSGDIGVLFLIYRKMKVMHLVVQLGEAYHAVQCSCACGYVLMCLSARA